LACFEAALKLALIDAQAEEHRDCFVDREI
jgi:hypothetical protein